MKFKSLVVFLCLMSMVVSVQAMSDMLATPDTIGQLKRDLRDGHVRIGKTRLHEVVNNYGKSISITDDDRRIVFEYDELRLEFVKRRLWRSWGYDSFRKPVYTDDVDDLRFDLESEELVGDNITSAKIIKDYGDPTEMVESDVDGEKTIYYYGDIKLVFENYFVVRSWRAQNLSDQETSGVLQGK